MGSKVAKLTFNPEHQNLEQIHRIVTAIIERAGCTPCGRLLRLDLEFLGDPAEIKRVGGGVIAIETHGM